jgi:hypothetical protein
MIPDLFGREDIEKDAHGDFIYSHGYIGHFGDDSAGRAAHGYTVRKARETAFQT